MLEATWGDPSGWCRLRPPAVLRRTTASDESLEIEQLMQSKRPARGGGALTRGTTTVLIAKTFARLARLITTPLNLEE